MRAAGYAVHAADLPSDCARGTFVAPTLIELNQVGDLKREVFGPVLHIVRYKRDDLDALIDALNATGFGLTFGLHTRLDETIAHVTDKIGAGNIYVNRNIVGAVVGVQPFGGSGLSGTGPKAGGPLYLHRLVQSDVGGSDARPETSTLPLVGQLREWLLARGDTRTADLVAEIGASAPGHLWVDLPGPVGEVNRYGLKPRGRVAAKVQSSNGLFAALASALATGNELTVDAPADVIAVLKTLPASLRNRVVNGAGHHGVTAVLYEGDGDGLLHLSQDVAGWEGAVIPVYGASREGLDSGHERFPIDRLLEEVVISTNTAAAGGNASLMTIG